MHTEKPIDLRVAALLDDLRLSNPAMHALALALRAAVLNVHPRVEEAVKYGGILFAAPAAFCGIFIYREHVSLEFGMGCDLDDTAGRLEGSGKFRRHLKLRDRADLQGIEPFLKQACDNANKAPAA